MFKISQVADAIANAMKVVYVTKVQNEAQALFTKYYHVSSGYKLIKSNQIYFSKMQDKYATTTLRIAEHRQENMAKPEGLKHTKLLALLMR